MYDIVKGSTSQSIDVFILDSASATGAGKTGLVFNTSGLSAYYRRGRVGVPTVINLVTRADYTAAWASGGFVEIDATHMPGWYRLDVPDAVFAAGENRAVINIMQASGAAPVLIGINLTNFDANDGVRGGLTALPNAAAGALNGLPLSVDASGRVDVAKIAGTAQTANDLGAKADVATSTRLAAAGYTAPDNTGIATAIAEATTAAVQATAGAASAAAVNLRVPASPAAIGDAMTLTAGERNAVADAHLLRDWTLMDLATVPARCALNALRAARNRWKIAGGILSVYKEDDTVVAWTAATTASSSNPITEVDPT